MAFCAKSYIFWQSVTYHMQTRKFIYLYTYKYPYIYLHIFSFTEITINCSLKIYKPFKVNKFPLYVYSLSIFCCQHNSFPSTIARSLCRVHHCGWVFFNQVARAWGAAAPVKLIVIHYYHRYECILSFLFTCFQPFFSMENVVIFIWVAWYCKCCCCSHCLTAIMFVCVQECLRTIITANWIVVFVIVCHCIALRTLHGLAIVATSIWTLFMPL